MTNQFTASQLLQESGTIPFRGFTEADNVAHEYPDELPVAGEQFDEDATWFLDALEVLPRAGKGQLIANNQFVKERDDGSVSVDVEEIQQVHGLDIDTIEEITGQSLESLGREAESHALPQIPVSGYKEIIDRRRLALRTLFDISCRYRFQISSSSYEAGDMLHLLGKKANTKYNDVFGWIRFRDYGGDVTITTIYSDINTEGVLSEIPDDVAIDFNEEQFRVGDGEGEKASDRFRELEEIAGQLLQYPVQQIQIANTEHNHRIEAEDDDETTLAPSQQTIAESLSDLQEVPGVITDELDLAESQQVQMKVQSTLEEVDAGSA